MDIPKPPSPPLDSDRILHELEDYYQQLVEYHQKAALAAQQKLMHVKALTGNESESEENLERLPELSSLKSHEAQTSEKSQEITSDKPSTGETSFFFQQLTLPEPTLFPLSAPLGNSEQDVSALSNLTKTDTVGESIKSDFPEIENDTSSKFTDFEFLKQEAVQRTVNESQSSSKEELLQQIEEILEEDKGKAVHLDYIIRTCRGIVLEQDMVSARDEFRLLLKHGVSVGKWDKVPDSPNCWTIRLEEMPEFAEDEDESDEFNLSSQSAIPNTALKTKEVSEKLGLTGSRISTLKTTNPSQFKEGIHYFRDKYNAYHWSNEGVLLLKKLEEQSNSNISNSSPVSLSKTPFAVLQEPYQDMLPMQALEKFFELHPQGQFATEEIVKHLYGKLEASLQKATKTRLGKTLSAGKQQGKWRNVRGRLGYYQANP